MMDINDIHEIKRLLFDIEEISLAEAGDMVRLYHEQGVTVTPEEVLQIFNTRLKISESLFSTVVQVMQQRITSIPLLKEFFAEADAEDHCLLYEILTHHENSLLATANEIYQYNLSYLDKDVSHVHNVMGIAKCALSERYLIEHANNRNLDLSVLDNNMLCENNGFLSELYLILEDALEDYVRLYVEYYGNIALTTIWTRFTMLWTSTEYYRRYYQHIDKHLLARSNTFITTHIGDYSAVTMAGHEFIINLTGVKIGRGEYYGYYSIY